MKHISAVSKLWRRLVIPSLFKHARLRLGGPLRQHWSECKTCNARSLTRRVAGLEA